MTTDDTTTAASADATGELTRSLESGPLADALLDVDRAVAGIETARATLTARRHDFARVFREQVTSHADDDTLADDLRAVIRILYWEYGTLRMSDLSAATGLGNERIRRIAGPQLVAEGCVACGAPTQVLQTRRGDRPTGRCPDCRQPARDSRDTFDDGEPFDAPWPPVPGSVGRPWLDDLLDHLSARVPVEGCDHQLTITRRWVRREGLSLLAVEDDLRRLGAYCDCEVLANAPRSPGAGGRGPML